MQVDRNSIVFEISHRYMINAMPIVHLLTVETCGTLQGLSRPTKLQKKSDTVKPNKLIKTDMQDL